MLDGTCMHLNNRLINYTYYIVNNTRSINTKSSKINKLLQTCKSSEYGSISNLNQAKLLT